MKGGRRNQGRRGRWVRRREVGGVLDGAGRGRVPALRRHKLHCHCCCLCCSDCQHLAAPPFSSPASVIDSGTYVKVCPGFVGKGGVGWFHLISGGCGGPTPLPRLPARPVRPPTQTVLAHADQTRPQPEITKLKQKSTGKKSMIICLIQT